MYGSKFVEFAVYRDPGSRPTAYSAIISSIILGGLLSGGFCPGGFFPEGLFVGGF